jgi:DNA-binding NarL/FixJ family response regulator
MVPIRVLLVDDSPAFLRAAARWLGAEKALEVVGTARDGGEAIREVERLRPDLVMMDLRMARVSGIEATRAIKRLPDPPRVVIMTIEEPSLHEPLVAAAGADGFVAKNEFRNQVHTALARIFPPVAPAPTHSSHAGESTP